MMSKNSEAIKKRMAESEEFRQEFIKEVQRLDLADLVFQLREQTGLNQTEFAKKVKKSRSTIARIESARVEPTISLLNDLAQAFDLNLEIKFVKKEKQNS
ncbi:helix-turn-helix transcriptional regulator [Enterococcus sp. 669A]|uniref:Helix-turn-helix transcriptional regulator n=2 Tax=Candidatus Enterococcus moelleringii TaxID=2815325 RepID=A0ABS3LD75_9ENTE|nr:helix-turn-helix transcriptional regulator [Enterococcus sp. 669A]